ncbi:ABC transporter substrate-binding protein [Clostridium sp. CCUG 7971]|uniref:ABC transporter substrate-binding protein n=1 Tax=Clostridium sp. CCUG 7971 TaxID=2811414 RepID=UPI001ABBCC49|nr:ABC transporter substrate-binding protein [Clostridium sp. CCUG 7971]MBO3445572.1 ABC transporter substrate-binding protein [Clostridium sp. CCUG 7971]
MNKKYLASIASLALVVSLVSGCGQNKTDNKSENQNTTIKNEKTSEKTTYPIEIEAFDSTGNTYKQTFKEAPKRVVTNNQSSTELLLELGLKDSLVGTGDLDNKVLDRLEDDYKSIPVISQKGDLAKEVLIGANPDMVIGRAASFTDERYGTIPSLNGMNINTYVQIASKMDTTQSLDNIILDVRNVGKIFNIKEKANKYADQLQDRLDKVKEKSSTIKSDPLKVMYMVKYDNGQFGVYGANASLQTEMLKLINAENVANKGGTLSTENLISLNPDAIVYVHADKNASTDKDAISSLLNNKLIQSVPAISNKKIIEVDYTELMGYGFRTFDALDKIASGLYPNIFN